MTADQVYSAQNIASAATAAAPRPDDLLGIRDQVYAENGIPQLRTDVSNAYQRILNFDTDTEAKQNYIQNKPLVEGALVGEQAQLERQRTQQRNALTRTYDALSNRLSAAELNAREVYGIRASEVSEKKAIMLQYAGAGIKWGDTTDKIAKKIAKFNKNQADKTYKDSLKEALLGMGHSVKGSTKELEKKLKKLNREEYDRAKKASDMQMKQAEIELQKSMKSLGQQTITIQDVAGWFGDGGSSTSSNTIQTPTGGMSIAPSNVESYWSKWGI